MSCSMVVVQAVCWPQCEWQRWTGVLNIVTSVVGRKGCRGCAGATWEEWNSRCPGRQPSIVLHYRKVEMYCSSLGRMGNEEIERGLFLRSLWCCFYRNWGYRRKGRMEAVLFLEIIRMTSTAKTGEGWERSRALTLGRWELWWLRYKQTPLLVASVFSVEKEDSSSLETWEWQAFEERKKVEASHFREMESLEATDRQTGKLPKADGSF